ncbi:MAG TPA: S8 family serine peptidase [Verrucomicrobiae bacterium]|jgi:hypothetical protein
MKLKLRLGILVVLLFGTAARATILDDLGVTLFRAVTTNLDGRGIAVAQPEASLSTDLQTWQVNPTTTSHPATIFTYASTNGSTNVFPNNIGKESSHADGVGQNLYGIPNGIATNLLRVDNSEADYFINTYVLSTLPPPAIGDPIVNQSFSFGPLSVSDQQQADSGYDDYAAQYRTLFVSAVNNYGQSAVVCAPGTAYNSIGVGAVYPVSYNNSIGPTPDNGRCKPDLSGRWGDTSTAAAQVSGAAAVLMQAALRGDGGSDTNSAFDLRTIKALLMNGAVKPADWTNSTASPLDMRYGAGVFNLFNSYEQLIGGKRSYIVSTTASSGGAHPPNGATGTVAVLSGWDLNTSSSSVLNDGINHYYFNVTNGAGTAKLTATLVWNRQQNQSAINNLNLFLYNVANSNLVICSTSAVDNVEHLYVTNLPAGRYDLQVWKAGGFGTVSSSETYALAWNFALPPTIAPVLTMAKSGPNAVLSWPILPNGFVVQSTANLNPPAAWSTDAIPAVIYTNQQNYIMLNPTNAGQFFRLVWP